MHLPVEYIILASVVAFLLIALVCLICYLFCRRSPGGKTGVLSLTHLAQAKHLLVLYYLTNNKVHEAGKVLAVIRTQGDCDENGKLAAVGCVCGERAQRRRLTCTSGSDWTYV